MRALQVRELTGPEGLELVELPEPEAGERVLIDVRAAGVSFPDLLLTRGLYQEKPDLPFVPGVEVAGVVRSAPPGSGFRPGDRVAAYTFLGGFAEVAAARADQTFLLPPGMAFDAAAGLVMNYQTAWFGLRRRGRLAEGETLAVHGSASITFLPISAK